MSDDQKEIGEYAGRDFRNPDDGSAPDLYVRGEPCFAFRVVAVPPGVRESFIEELAK